MKFKRIISFDFDGVIHKYESKWVDYDVIPDSPVDGIKELINYYKDEYKIVILSSRAKEEKGVNAIKSWLEKYEIYYDEITCYKVPSLIHIDDRTIKFNGNTIQLRKEIDSFSTWNENLKRGKLVKDKKSIITYGEYLKYQKIYPFLCNMNDDFEDDTIGIIEGNYFVPVKFSNISLEILKK